MECDWKLPNLTKNDTQFCLNKIRHNKNNQKQPIPMTKTIKNYYVKTSWPRPKFRKAGASISLSCIETFQKGETSPSPHKRLTLNDSYFHVIHIWIRIYQVSPSPFGLHRRLVFKLSQFSHSFVETRSISVTEYISGVFFSISLNRHVHHT